MVFRTDFLRLLPYRFYSFEKEKTGPEIQEPVLKNELRKLLFLLFG